jgi:Nucleotide exchange factor Fes1
MVQSLARDIACSWLYLSGVDAEIICLLFISFIYLIFQELMQKLKMPSDAELMKIAIADLNNSSSSSQERLRALNELLVLVEPIDNALGNFTFAFFIYSEGFFRFLSHLKVLKSYNNLSTT